MKNINSKTSKTNGYKVISEGIEVKNKVAEIKQEDRPTCSCGRKMTIVAYKGYYETFNYFECGYCGVDPDDYKADDYTMGAYA